MFFRVSRLLFLLADGDGSRRTFDLFTFFGVTFFPFLASPFSPSSSLFGLLAFFFRGRGKRVDRPTCLGSRQGLREEEEEEEAVEVSRHEGLLCWHRVRGGKPGVRLGTDWEGREGGRTRDEELFYHSLTKIEDGCVHR